MFKAIATIFIMSFVATAAHAQVYHEEGAEMQTERVYNQAPAPILGEGHHRRCLPGYEWYPQVHECNEVHAPRFVRNTQCTPGQSIRVPDPARRGGYRILTCMVNK